MTITLPPTAETDALVKDLIASTTYIDAATGEPYRPKIPPVVIDPKADADERG
ncbi:MAG: hypothetical protein M3Y41_02115 [Pseudomonadota bacterium]|nr:hypothetical protein [Pseudomonadota bacterium]